MGFALRTQAPNERMHALNLFKGNTVPFPSCNTMKHSNVTLQPETFMNKTKRLLALVLLLAAGLIGGAIAGRIGYSVPAEAQREPL